jgi:hypothetical protein
MEFQLSSNNLISEIESLRNAEMYSVYQKIRGHREALRVVKAGLTRYRANKHPIALGVAGQVAFPVAKFH